MYFEKCWLLKFLLMIGIGFSFKRKAKLKTKICYHFLYFLKPFNLIFYASIFYSFTALMWNNDRFQKYRLVIDLCLVFAVSLWIFLQLNAHIFYKFVRNLRGMRGIEHNNKREITVTNVCLVLAIAIPLLFAASVNVAMYLNPEESYVNYWYLGTKRIPNRDLETVVIFICMFFYFSARYTVPGLSIVIHSAICFEVSKSIHVQSENIEKSLYTKKFNQEVQLYHKLIEHCKKFSVQVTFPMFVMIVDYFLIMYIGLTLAIGKMDYVPRGISGVLGFLTIANCAVCTIGLITLAAKVPQAMQDAAARFHQLYREALLKSEILEVEKQFTVLKALSEMKPIYMNGFNWFRIDKGLILTTFGSTLTYCILIYQLKKSYEAN